MSLFRFIALLLLLWIGWFMLKNHLAAKARKSAGTARRMPAARMVRCRHCDVHLPEAEALSEDDEPFCCKEHLLAWRRRG